MKAATFAIAVLASVHAHGQILMDCTFATPYCPGYALPYSCQYSPAPVYYASYPLYIGDYYPANFGTYYPVYPVYFGTYYPIFPYSAYSPRYTYAPTLTPPDPVRQVEAQILWDEHLQRRFERVSARSQALRREKQERREAVRRFYQEHNRREREKRLADQQLAD